jgi:hypothetical protein
VAYVFLFLLATTRSAARRFPSRSSDKRVLNGRSLLRNRALLRNQSAHAALLHPSEGMRSTSGGWNMRKFALVLASVAGLGFAAPAFASDDGAAAPRMQLAQLGVSVNVGTPGVVVRDRHYHRRHHHHRRHYHSHRAQSDVVIVKKRKPVRKTVIIDRR